MFEKYLSYSYGGNTKRYIMDGETIMTDKKTYPNVLLVGNGINRTYGLSSWDDLLSKIQTKKLSKEEKECLDKIPYPLRPVILTEDNVSNKMKENAEDLCAFKPVDAEVKLIQKFLTLSVDAILTTNYTYEIEMSICPEFECKVGRSSKFRKKEHVDTGKYELNQLHTYFLVGEDKPRIWHIHGEAAKPDTMILGHYYYGKLLAKIQQYVPKLISRYKGCISKEQKFKYNSWIDYFLLGNVYIVGLGMDLSEMDLWWLINCKKRNFSGGKTVLYKPDIKKEEQLLAEAYGVEVVTDGLYEEDYMNYYKWVFDDIRKQ